MQEADILFKMNAFEHYTFNSSISEKLSIGFLDRLHYTCSSVPSLVAETSCSKENTMYVPNIHELCCMSNQNMMWVVALLI